MSSLFFPESPRSFAGMRAVRMTLRAAHILATGTLIGGHIFTQSQETLVPWLIATIASGALLLLLELYASFAVLVELHGALVLVKCVLVALVAVLWDVRVVLLGITLCIGVYGSHMSGKLRHYQLLLRGRVKSSKSIG